GHAQIVILSDLNRTSVLATGRALGVAANLERPKRLLERVIGEESAHQRVAQVQYQLDRFDGLEGSDDPGQHTEYTSFGAARREFGGRWLGNHAAVARPDVGVEDGDLAIETEDGSVHDR